jgi:zinc protease
MGADGLPKLELNSLPGPDDTLRTEFSNGLVFLARENFSSPSVVISGYLEVGALDESGEQAGLAALTASALLRGTQQRSFNQIYEQLESIGASLQFSASKHQTSFWGKSLAEDLGVLLDILAEALQQPRFERTQVERLRTERLTALAIRDHDTGSRAVLAFNELVYPKHPYGVSTDGYKDSVGELTPAALRSFHRQHYSPQGMLLCVVGGVRARKAAAQAEERLGEWQAQRRRPMPPLPQAKALRRFRRRHVRLAGKSQCDLVMGVAGPARSDPGYLEALLGNSILGRFGLQGRIGDAVRERAGLAYYAYSTVMGGLGPGPWQVMAGVAPGDVARAVEIIRKEIEAFVSGPPSRRELRENQSNFIGRLPLQLESNEGVAGALVNIERHKLGLDYYRRFPALVAEVTREGIQEVARRFLHPDQMALATAGPDHAGA